MKDQLIEFETVKLAKEKGFEWFTMNYFGQINGEPFESAEGSLDDYNSSRWDEEGGEWISQPTQSLLQKWLRENHDTHVGVVLRENFWNCNLYKVKSGQYLDTVFNNGNHAFDNYEQALEQGLYEALELIEV